ncbi:MAG: hypothetical protein JRH20_05715 [Deltaproteobacteria bacterium]|nr:hypothetical protein [Deltaproteobacteria bacterium]
MNTVTTRYATPRLDLGLEGTIWLPNVLLVMAFVLHLLITQLGIDRIQPLVITDATSTQRIKDLERSLALAPRRSDVVIELSRLYARAGELPLSYDALRDAEQNGSRDAYFKMRLAMAYLEVGKNADGRRVMQSALEACDLTHCPPRVRARLSIFSQVADIYVERNIDTRRYPHLAAKVFDEVVRKVEKSAVDMIMRAAKKAEHRATSRPAFAPKGSRSN